MRDRPGREAKIDERHVGHGRNDAGPRDRVDRARRLAEPVVQDRDVVGPEIPRHADVLLVQAEIDPAHRDEIDLAKLSVADVVAHEAHRQAVEERVAGHQRQPALVRQPDQFRRVL